MSRPLSFRGKRVLVMGLGLLGGGEGAARFFANKGAAVTVTDLKTKAKLSPSIEKLRGLPIRYVLGRHEEKDFTTPDLIIRNPDVLPTSPYLSMAKKCGIPIEMVESFFAKHCKIPIIAVTGTRGKTTTATLIASILTHSGFDTILAGNTPEVSTLDFLDKVTPSTKVVLELSSWQLQGFAESKVSPRVAVITNIYPDHLNHYPTLEAYIDDKKNIFRYQKREDFLILNGGNALSRGFAKEAFSKVIFFHSSDVPASFRLRLVGRHNRENVAAAINVANICKVQRAILRRTIEQFKPLPFRIEIVRKLNGITFVNDGVSTTPEATMAAIRAFQGNPLILLIGGTDKLLDFKKLGRLIGRNVQSVFLMEGSATPKIEREIVRRDIVKGTFRSLSDTLSSAYKYARSGDVILFSPAATSFEWFNNIYHRSVIFEKMVKNL